MKEPKWVLSGLLLDLGEARFNLRHSQPNRQVECQERYERAVKAIEETSEEMYLDWLSNQSR